MGTILDGLKWVMIFLSKINDLNNVSIMNKSIVVEKHAKPLSLIVYRYSKLNLNDERLG
jgi:hypothetical protein